MRIREIEAESTIPDFVSNSHATDSKEKREKSAEFSLRDANVLSHLILRTQRYPVTSGHKEFLPIIEYDDIKDFYIYFDELDAEESIPVPILEDERRFLEEKSVLSKLDLFLKNQKKILSNDHKVSNLLSWTASTDESLAGYLVPYLQYVALSESRISNNVKSRFGDKWVAPSEMVTMLQYRELEKIASHFTIDDQEQAIVSFSEGRSVDHAQKSKMNHSHELDKKEMSERLLEDAKVVFPVIQFPASLNQVSHILGLEPRKVKKIINAFNLQPSSDNGEQQFNESDVLIILLAKEIKGKRNFDDTFIHTVTNLAEATVAFYKEEKAAS